ncbi:LamG-like jellyroll fold domain-containing protein [Thalassoglobus sp. JC818]|uniref:LamG-like jellyroll fold domain-containing protein n=1 Tax=Thalassoglobus sp. JC818 TaxID=3232136 RepID=UPI0034597678
MYVSDEFIDRILDGSASNSEVEEFQLWLQVPENLERYALRTELHADLRRSLQRKHIETNALNEGTVNSLKESNSPQKTRHMQKVRTSKGLLLTVTGFATAACLFIAFLQLAGRNNPIPTQHPTALVISNVSGVLTKDGQLWTDSSLPVGGYELQKGLLNLQFGGGVMVYVEAPASFDAVNDKRVVLHRGRLSARVPPEGIGFTVETPEAEVVDYGTEFSVDVESGASEVHVFDGLVRVHPGMSNQRDSSKSVDLKASQALRISDDASEPEDISLATDRFIRNFDEPSLNYARAIKRLSPLAFYRMPIRDRGLVSEPLEYSGVVLTGDGKRPPHAKGVFVGGSLRVGADSTGRGGRVDSPPAWNTEQFSLTVFVYLEEASHIGTVATNLNDERGNFSLSLDESGKLQATIKDRDGDLISLTGDSSLDLKSWRHVVVTVDGEAVSFFEEGKLVASTPFKALAVSESDPLWFGTDASLTDVWNGRIDEVALFDRALSADEVASLYRTAQEEIARLP